MGAVFVSHSSRDWREVKRLVDAVEARGVRCWLSERDIPPGANYGDSIVDAVDAAPTMILVFSANANESQEIKKEVALASQRRLNVVPIRIADVAPSKAFAYELITRNWIDFFDNWDAGLERLMLSLDPSRPPAPPPFPKPAPKAGTSPLVLGGGGLALVAAAAAGYLLLRAPTPAPAPIPTPTIAVETSSPTRSIPVAPATPTPSATPSASLATPAPARSPTPTPTPTPAVAVAIPTAQPSPSTMSMPTSSPAVATPTPSLANVPPPRVTAEDAGGEVFRECDHCPEMVVAPVGSAKIGSPGDEKGHDPGETQRVVTIAKPFALGRFAVTFREWDACVADGGCGDTEPGDFGMGRNPRQPAILVTVEDAERYVAWLSKKTGHVYRLPSEAEWEYAARACRASDCPYQAFWFGSITPKAAVYDWKQSYLGSPTSAQKSATQTVDSGAPNPFGLYNMLGNVRQMTADCWSPVPPASPSDGKALKSGDCGQRATRGGSWNDAPQDLRAAARRAALVDEPSAQIGFRVARDLEGP